MGVRLGGGVLFDLGFGFVRLLARRLLRIRVRLRGCFRAFLFLLCWTGLQLLQLLLGLTC